MKSNAPNKAMKAKGLSRKRTEELRVGRAGKTPAYGWLIEMAFDFGHGKRPTGENDDLFQF